ncbi:MAG: NAD(P)H-hydrate dehydratase [Chloroflexi bacterium]|nr:NAD(P)H-hydrate dehydratase [Chloroflexota bacterium]
MKIVTVEQMRALEAAAGERGVSVEALMEKAGLAVANHVMQQLGNPRGARVLALVGPGNNGGDGLVAARHLHQWGARVCVYLCAPRKTPDPMLLALEDRGVLVFNAEQDPFCENLKRELAASPLIVDAVLGTGKARPLEGLIVGVLGMASEARKAKGLTVVAVDLPTGLNADTGELDPAALPADVTVALGYPKTGHFTFPGPAATGRLEIVDIGIPKGLDSYIPVELITPDLARSLLPQRPLDGHKGTFGRLLAVAGSRSYVGAAYLACTGAYRVGAGLVTLAAPEGIYPILAAKLTETTHTPLKETPAGAISIHAQDTLREVLADYDALLIGCGLSGEDDLRIVLSRFLLDSPGMENKPAVLDADALNALARISGWHTRLKASAVLTPHPGEMARLYGGTPAQVQAARMQIALQAAKSWGQTVVLKGAYTVVASPKGVARVSPFANPGLASAGTGDVLAGVIGGLLAQGLPSYDAAACGVYLHGAAGEEVRRHLGDAGMVAGDLLPELPKQIKALKAKPASSDHH